MRRSCLKLDVQGIYWHIRKHADYGNLRNNSSYEYKHLHTKIELTQRILCLLHRKHKNCSSIDVNDFQGYVIGNIIHVGINDMTRDANEDLFILVLGKLCKRQIISFDGTTKHTIGLYRHYACSRRELSAEQKVTRACQLSR